MLLINSIIFISAFLLFQIELIIAKLFLPNYGGSYFVWGCCVVFFQAVLLLGYIFAHLVTRKPGIVKYRYFHLIFILLPLFFFPGKTILLGLPSAGLPLSIDVFRLLIITIGPVFFVLSTISILGQSWLAASSLKERLNPYTLYSVSNFGAFAALLSYPFVFELFLTLDQQLIIWRIAYIVLIALHFFAVFKIKMEPPIIEAKVSTSRKKRKLKRSAMLQWFLLGATATIMFLSVNNIITAEIDPLPLLWIITLSIFLLAFVFNFKRSPWCPQWIKKYIHITLALSISLYFLLRQQHIPIVFSLSALCIILFILCMYIQNRLYSLKPTSTRHLTHFYVINSFGSFIGGLTVSWFIPLASKSFIEFLIGILLIAMCICFESEYARRRIYSNTAYAIAAIVTLILWPKFFQTYSLFGVIVLLVIMGSLFMQLRKNNLIFFLCIAAIVCISPYLEETWYATNYVQRFRNYYGSIEITYTNHLRILRHGTTNHGAQFLREDRKNEPIFYYTRKSPMGRLLLTDLFDFKNIAVVGLGTGTLATYLEEDQRMDFFELDEDVHKISSKYFSFLDDSKGETNVIIGDARVNISKMPQRYYDLIVMDAFSGDYIPTHLVTKEAIELYRKHLKDDGVLIFHISNRYFNIAPILASTGFKHRAKIGVRLGASGVFSYQSTWIAMAWDENTFKKLSKDLAWTQIKPHMVKNWKPWTDNYSSVIPILIDSFLQKIKNIE